METIKYNGQNVYTQSSRNVTSGDLQRAKRGEGTVVDAYFFELGIDSKSGFRIAERIGFDRAKIEAEKSGLQIDVDSQFGGQASVSIAGLERIVGFLCDSGALGDLSALKGKKVSEYDAGALMLGIGLPAYKQKENEK